MASSRRVGALTVRGYVSAKRIRDKVWSLLASGAFRDFGRASVIALPVRLLGASQISIGERVYVGPGSWLQVIGDPTQPGITVGSDTKIAGGCVLSAAADLRIGDGVLLASNVYLSDHSHAFGRGDRFINLQGIDRISPVEIQDGAWLGENVVVMPGVTIGRGAVVGANSVVTEDVPPRAVAVGAPARIVKHITADSREDVDP
jgi:acetyltransferase-like isoleucine patch superfamily enzyme